MSTVTREPTVRDEVKHNTQDYTGVVLAKYPGQVDPTKNYLDVRLDDDKVYYGTPAANWSVTIPVEDLE